MLLGWLPASMNIYDSRFGIFSPKHGLLIELRIDDGQAVDNVPSRVLVFLSFHVPFLSVIKRDELQLASTLSAITVFHLRALLEYSRQERKDESLGQGTNRKGE